MSIFFFHVILFFFLLDVVPSIALTVYLRVQKNNRRKISSGLNLPSSGYG